MGRRGSGAVIIASVVLAIVISVLFVVFVVPAVIFIIDLLFVVARSDAYLSEWAVVGWKASGAAIELVQRAIARGDSLDALRLRLL